MTLLKLAVPAAALAVIIAATTGTAAAEDVPVTPRTVTVTGNFTGILANGLTVVYDCAAVATADAVSVAITDCYLTTGSKNSRIALPGPAVTVAGTDRVPLADFRLCYTAVATFSNASTKTAGGCTGTLPAGAAQIAGTGFATSAA